MIVSHDRFFMDKVAEHLLCFEGNGVVRDFPGSYSLYRAWCEHEEQKRAEERQRQSERQAPTAPTNAKPTGDRRPPRLSYSERKELEQIEQQLASLEAEQQTLEAILSGGEALPNQLVEASTRIGQIMEAMDELVLRQLELEEKVG